MLPTSSSNQVGDYANWKVEVSGKVEVTAPSTLRITRYQPCHVLDKIDKYQYVLAHCRFSVWTMV